MRTNFLISILYFISLIAFVACGGSGGDSKPTQPAANTPNLTGVTPAANDNSVLLGNTVAATFDKTMNVGSAGTFVVYRPTHNISKIMQWLKGISSRILLSEFAHLRKQFWGRHLWARDYLAVSSGNVTDEMIQQYIEDQEGEPIVDDSRFLIDSP